MRPFHETINARRIELGLTYEQVFEMFQKRTWADDTKPPSLAVVGHWFNGTRRPRDMQHLIALCDALDLSIDEAVKGEPEAAATAVEVTLLRSMRGLDAAQQQILLAMAAALRRTDNKGSFDG